MKEKNIFKGKHILVTGGTGSIGSELVRQLLKQKPAVIRVFSRDESKQYYLAEEIGRGKSLRYLIGDVRDLGRLKRAMRGIDIVFHAAALKHVPSCEYNPFEAVQTNVIGTMNVIEAAIDNNVSRVISISTDKAINPSNTMGATKLLAEKLVAANQLWISGTILAGVRFGNVLGSRGSLVPIIRSQVEKGGPVTITDKNMTRFMMSIADACKLVLKASQMAKGGEIFILKMPAMKIADFVDVLVDEFAPQYGCKPSQIERKIIGVRPGEKIHEALLTGDEAERTVEYPDMYKVVPEIQKFTGSSKIAPDMYESEKAKLLDKKSIRKLLKDAHIL